MDKTESLGQIRNEYGALPPRYELLSLIGRGASGVVVQAKELLLERDVAIKMLNSTAEQNTEQFARFTREARILSGMDHKHIVKILNSGFTEKMHPYHVLELLQGVTLAKRLEEMQVLPTELFFKVFLQILEGLDYAHSQHIVHRDIKPSNLMICQQAEGTICTKIIDFGVGTLDFSGTGNDAALTKTGILIGTPLYMSPEQCKGTPAQNKSDIYSLACVMYQSLTGSAPFAGESSMEIMYKHMHENAPSLAATKGDARLSVLIADCLKKDPAERPATSEVLARLSKLSQEFSGTLQKFQIAKVAPLKYGTVTTILLLGLLVICSSIWMIRSSYNTSSALPMIVRNKDSRQKDLLLEDIDRLQKRFDTQKDKQEKRHLGFVLCHKIELLAKEPAVQISLDKLGQAKSKQVLEGPQLFKRILNICDSLGPSEGLPFRFNAALNLGCHERVQRHFQEASHYFNEAESALRLSGLEKTQGDFYEERAKLELDLHNMEAAKAYVVEALNVRRLDQRTKLKNEVIARNQGRLPFKSEYSSNRVLAIIEYVSSLRFDSDMQRIVALEICNEATEFLIEAKFEKNLEAVDYLLKILSTLSPKSTRYKVTARATYALAEKEAKQRDDQVTVAKYKSLAAQL